MTVEPNFAILDGGMGRLLERLGAPFRLPEWSALSLIEAPLRKLELGAVHVLDADGHVLR